MVRHAIDLGGGLVVMPVFEQYQNERLTPKGLQTVTTTKCILFDAHGLEVLGVGYSIKDPNDPDDVDKALKLSLGRALKDANRLNGPMLSPCDRDEIFKALLRDIRQNQETQVVIEVTPVYRPTPLALR